jgi:hypothetical protein
VWASSELVGFRTASRVYCTAVWTPGTPSWLADWVMSWVWSRVTDVLYCHSLAMTDPGKAGGPVVRMTWHFCSTEGTCRKT